MREMKWEILRMTSVRRRERDGVEYNVEEDENYRRRPRRALRRCGRSWLEQFTIKMLQVVSDDMVGNRSAWSMKVFLANASRWKRERREEQLEAFSVNFANGEATTNTWKR